MNTITSSVLGLGIDCVEVARFNTWHQYSLTQLRRIYAEEEIVYCLSSSTKSAERFAVRFAAREAIVKALSMAFAPRAFSLLTLSRHIVLQHTANGSIQCVVDWQQLLQIPSTPYTVLVSLSHTATLAYAQALITTSSLM